MTVVRNDKTIQELKETTKKAMKWRFLQSNNALSLEKAVTELKKAIPQKTSIEKNNSYLPDLVKIEKTIPSLKKADFIIFFD